MLKKTITYTDYFDEVRTEDFYFNITKAELIEMEMSTKGGMEYYLNKIVAEKDREQLFQYFKKIILAGYGEKSADGRQFMKSPEISKRFECCPAYDVLMMELLNNADDAAKFVTALMPKDLAEQVNKMEAKNLHG